ncbi:hypothetical protein C1H46_019444 [Malus baccata]|uniref:Uncharacterized protein n=1 Tax=Malus baccata TaxID=106549 RepID=A0A540M902_MALBA|nr:hypothetical protein C1H46_019444 [Malus baccata]
MRGWVGLEWAQCSGRLRGGEFGSCAASRPVPQSSLSDPSAPHGGPSSPPDLSVDRDFSSSPYCSCSLLSSTTKMMRVRMTSLQFGGGDMGFVPEAW